MFDSNKLLVIVDPRQQHHHAIPRAAELASRLNSKLILLSCVYQRIVEFIPFGSPIDAEIVKDEAIAYYENELRQLAKPLLKEGIEVDYQVVWHKSYHRGLSEFINQHSIDLAIKTARSHSTLGQLFFTPTDWHLLRDTKTNILFVKKGVWPSATNILGAINVESDDDHRLLNQKIVDTTAKLAETFNCEAHILNVFPWPKVNFESFKHLFQKRDLFLEIKQEHKKEVYEFVKDYPALLDNIIIAEGLEADETIPEIIQSTHSDLLVMGTVGRKGMAAAMVGNTAEKILDQLECEVLALK